MAPLLLTSPKSLVSGFAIKPDALCMRLWLSRHTQQRPQRLVNELAGSGGVDVKLICCKWSSPSRFLSLCCLAGWNRCQWMVMRLRRDNYSVSGQLELHRQENRISPDIHCQCMRSILMNFSSTSYTDVWIYGTLGCWFIRNTFLQLKQLNTIKLQ